MSYTYPIVTLSIMNDTIVFQDTDVIEAEVTQEIHPIGIEVPASKATIRVWLDDEVTDEEGRTLRDKFRPFSDGIYYQSMTTGLIVDVSERIVDEDNSIDTEHFVGRFYLEEWNTTKEGELELDCTDAVGLMENTTYLGNFYETPTRADIILADIFNNVDLLYSVETGVAQKYLKGYIPGDITLREALQQVLFACGAFAITEKNEIDIVFLNIKSGRLPIANPVYPGYYYEEEGETEPVSVYDSPMIGLDVIGAGSSEVNGWYNLDGERDGKPRYFYYNEALLEKAHYVVWLASKQAWYISRCGGGGDPDFDVTYYALYSSTEDVATPDLVTNWVADVYGVSPMPTLTLYDYPQTTWYTNVLLDTIVTNEEKTDSQELNILQLVTGVEITSHDYSKSETLEEIYNAYLAPGEYMVVYDKPYWHVEASGVGDRITYLGTTTPTNEDGQDEVLVFPYSGETYPDVTILTTYGEFEFGANYVYLYVPEPGGTAVVSGKPWLDAKQNFTWVNPAGITSYKEGAVYDDPLALYDDAVYYRDWNTYAPPNVWKITNATLVPFNKSDAEVTVEEVLARVAEYASLRYQQKANLFPRTDLELGEIDIIESLYGKSVVGVVERINSDLTGGYLIDAEFIGVERVTV